MKRACHADGAYLAAAQGTASRIEGVGFEQLGADALAQHAVAYRGHLWPEDGADAQELPNPGDYHFRCVRTVAQPLWGRCAQFAVTSA